MRFRRSDQRKSTEAKPRFPYRLSAKQVIWSESDVLVCLAPRMREVAFRGAGWRKALAV